MISQDSPEWQMLKEKLLRHACADSQALARHGLGMERTEYLRGRISLAEELLQLADSTPPVPETPDY